MEEIMNELNECSNEETSPSKKRRRPGRPTRPKAQKSVHELVLNITQNSSKMTTNEEKVVKKQKTTKDVPKAVPAVVDDRDKHKDKDKDKDVKECCSQPMTTHSYHIGQRVEARDAVGKKWYNAKVVDVTSDKLLVHFERWSSRFDQWFELNSDLIREKKTTTAADVQHYTIHEFEINEEVFAKWNDSHKYRAHIIQKYEEQNAVLVLFTDGYRKKLKIEKISKLLENEKQTQEITQNITTATPSTSTSTSTSTSAATTTATSKESPAVDHNEFQCNECQKGFRKQSLLLQHLKHYHHIIPRAIDPKPESKPTTTTTMTTTTPTTPTMTTTTQMSNNNDVNDIKKIEEIEEKREMNENYAREVIQEMKQNEREKRKYVRKPLPSVIRKSNRQSKAELSISKSVADVNNRNNGCQQLMSAETTTASPTMTTTPSIQANTLLPFWDARTIREMHESDEIDELVNCLCDAHEESGLMVQCEECLCWQHAICMQFTDESEIPKNGYFCRSCRFPKLVRKSRQNSFLTNHVIKRNAFPRFPFTSGDADVGLTSGHSEKEFQFNRALNRLLSANFDSKLLLKSLNAKIFSTNQETKKEEIIEKQREISENLSKIESKIEKLEKELSLTFDVVNVGDDKREDIKELLLLFNDLKNAKSIQLLNQ